MLFLVQRGRMWVTCTQDERQDDRSYLLAVPSGAQSLMGGQALLAGPT